jgi:predicted Zn-dependent protease
MKAFSFMKTNRQQEAIEIVNELRQNRPSDPTIAKYLVYVLNDLGLYSETTTLLEYVMTVNLDNEELSEELFFAYVREGKLLKQQN